jgi:hypothetical protein
MSKTNLIYSVLAILETKEELQRLHALPIEQMGAERLRLEQECRSRFISLVGSCPFEEILAELTKKDGKGAA